MSNSVKAYNAPRRLRGLNPDKLEEALVEWENAPGRESFTKDWARQYVEKVIYEGPCSYMLDLAATHETRREHKIFLSVIHKAVMVEQVINLTCSDEYDGHRTRYQGKLYIGGEQEFRCDI